MVDFFSELYTSAILVEGDPAYLSYLLVFVALSLLIGWPLRRSWPECFLFGFLFINAGANLSLFLFRALSLDISWLGYCALGTALILAISTRLWIAPPQESGRLFDIPHFLGFSVLAASIWFTQILIPEPSAGLTAHQPWYPLYIDYSFDIGRFAVESDLAFAPGILSGLLLNVDLIGLVALGRWLDLGQTYAAFLAGAICAGLAATALLAWSFRGRPLILLIFMVLFLALLRWEGEFRLFVGYNWGDVLVYTSGAGVLFYLGRARQDLQALALMSLAAIFLPFGRSYGVGYAGLLCLLAMIASYRGDGRLEVRVWLSLFIMGSVFSARELWLLIFVPSPYYSVTQWLSGFPSLTSWLYDIGIDLSANRTNIQKLVFAMAPISLVLALLGYRHRLFKDRALIWLLFAPWLLYLIPGLLKAATGYGGASLNKLYVLKLFVPAWYPAKLFVQSALAERLSQFGTRRGLVIISAFTIVMTIAVIGVFSEKISDHPLIAKGPKAAFASAFESYRLNNPDLVMSRAINQQPAALRQRIKSSRIMYIHDEPGLALRYFIGGNLFADMDFWSEEVFNAMRQTESFKDLVHSLGDPVIYISLAESPFHYGRFFQDKVFLPFLPQVRALDQADWIAHRIRTKYGAIFVPAREEK